MTAIPTALAFARRLDALLPTADDALSDLLSFDVGELLGGLSAQGFAADLQAAINRAGLALYEDNPREWSAGLGGNDPDAFVSSWLEDQITDEQERVAAEWLRDATALLAPHDGWQALASMTSAADVRGSLGVGMSDDQTVAMTEPFEIKNRWTDRVQFTASIAFGIPTLGLRIGAAVKWAREKRENLSGADLRGAVLRDAVLRGADLSGADLSGADLSVAVLRDADLRDADLRGADLRGADLSDAVLRDADLSGADLSGAELSDADLSGAVLSDADLRGADLRPIRADLYDVLVTARGEAPAFLAALRAGKVDGSTYQGECACLVGTLANVRGVYFGTMYPDVSRPIERFVMGIKRGDTPETNPVAKLVAEWTAAFIGHDA